MKKILPLLLVIAFVAGLLASCGSPEQDTTLDIGSYDPLVWEAVDVEPYASIGKIDTVEIEIGTSFEDVIEHYGNVFDETDEDFDDLVESGLDMGHAHDHDDEHTTLMRSRHDPRFVELRTQYTAYYYVTDGSLINFIAHFDDAFGFMVSVTPIEDVANIVGEDFARKTAIREDLFFVIAPLEEGVEILYKDFENFRLQFVFFEGVLMATTIQNLNVWNF